MTPPRPASVAHPQLHPRNRHGARYDFVALIGCSPELTPFVAPNAYGDDSIDFADPLAVRALNRALLKHAYGIAAWTLPARYLCPPIPGRADYLHYLADLLADVNSEIPRGRAVRVFDIGTGANLVYPLIGHAEYGWHFVGSDIERDALANAQAIVDANAGLAGAIELRLQTSPANVFKGVIRRDERFDLVMCNPPFHASLEDARAGSERKWRNLGKFGKTSTPRTPTLNFGGRGAELVYPGGEAGFIRRIIDESARMPDRCLWFTTLVSKAENLRGIEHALTAAGVRARRTIEMAQGQKKSRIIAWTYLTARQRQAWRTGAYPAQTTSTALNCP
ncbi:MAG: 23S rRNA (adenine(1618)-N(6))-methyltransferase RlmF [Propionivibrio sp.]